VEEDESGEKEEEEMKWRRRRRSRRFFKDESARVRGVRLSGCEIKSNTNHITISHLQILQCVDETTIYSVALHYYRSFLKERLVQAHSCAHALQPQRHGKADESMYIVRRGRLTSERIVSRSGNEKTQKNEQQNET
jgi:hypothetical protein